MKQPNSCRRPPAYRVIPGSEEAKLLRFDRSLQLRRIGAMKYLDV
jgi:hypothetical protein